MLKKTLIAVSTALVLGGGLLATSGSAEARSRDHHHSRYERVRVCEPVIRWKWRHHHRVRVVVGRECHWVKVRHNWHPPRHHHRRY